MLVTTSVQYKSCVGIGVGQCKHAITCYKQGVDRLKNFEIFQKAYIKVEAENVQLYGDLFHGFLCT